MNLNVCILISKIFQGPPMNIKLESEPLEVECNPFNFSSGGPTGKKRRKKKDKEKKVKDSIKSYSIMNILRHKFRSCVNILLMIFITCSNEVLHTNVKYAQKYSWTETVSIITKRNVVLVRVYLLRLNPISILEIGIIVFIKTVCRKEWNSMLTSTHSTQIELR